MSKKTESPGILVQMVSEDNSSQTWKLKSGYLVCSTHIGVSATLGKNCPLPFF